MALRSNEPAFGLVLSPSGCLRLQEDMASTPDAWLKRVAAGFATSQAAGLFALAATKPDTPPPSPLSFWDMSTTLRGLT